MHLYHLFHHRGRWDMVLLSLLPGVPFSKSVYTLVLSWWGGRWHSACPNPARPGGWATALWSLFYSSEVTRVCWHPATSSKVRDRSAPGASSVIGRSWQGGSLRKASPLPHLLELPWFLRPRAGPSSLGPIGILSFLSGLWPHFRGRGQWGAFPAPYCLMPAWCLHG